MIADKEIDLNSGDLKAILKRVQKETNEILEEDKVAKTMHH